MMQFIKKDCLEKDVEERIIVKESQKAAVGIVVGIALFWLLCLGLVAIGICNGEEWNGIFVAYLIAISWTIPILVYTGLSYRFRRLELSGRACSYRNVLGKRIDFMACDVVFRNCEYDVYGIFVSAFMFVLTIIMLIASGSSI